MTPNFAVIGIQTPHWHMPRLWLPVFLLWIPALLLSPLIFLALVAFAIPAKTTIWRVSALLWAILSGLPGTDIQVAAKETRILVRIL